ncbi:nucleoporin NUP42-like [Tigriopus californicus]|uniref:nucleoporin NUP42-like n=1 Tax=Tigriopus californicus TaxID=6832 RepID=UPI0027DA8DC7|nr:nucleoporin NUP42-like [Tigriopus californicus]
MTICYYYQQGRCSFGNQCRFAHPAPNRSSEDMTNTLVKTVELDMETWEKGHQWVFSCYAPAKEVHCFPDIDDISPEEMRFEAYASRDSNTSQAYQQKFQELLSSYALKRKALAKPSEEIKGILRRLYAKEKVVLPPGSNVFNAAANVGSIFGGSATTANSSNIFQNRTNQQPFGGTQSNAASIFGGGQPTPSNSIFGGGSTSLTGGKPAIFGGGSTANNQSAPSPFSSGIPNGSSSIFGGASTTQSPGSSIFGGANQNQASPSTFTSSTKSPFGQSPFGQPTANTSSIFGGSSQPQMQQSMSGTNTTFGQPQNSNPSGSVFDQGQSKLSSPFSGSSISNQGPSVFGGQMANSPSTNSPFGGGSSAPQTAANPFSSPSVAQSPFGNSPQGANTPPSNVPSPFVTTAQGIGNQSTFSNPPPPLPSRSIGGAAPSNPFLSQSANSTNAGGLFAAVGGGSGSTGLFGQKLPEMTDPYRYTPLDQFSPEELAVLKGEEFELGRIPERPPPLELCF